jgi:hypothetical protein
MMQRWIALAGALAASAAAHAHDGHGFEGPHWHAADVFGVVAAAVVAAVGLVLWLRK